jgi:hypothetical protein
VEALPRNPSQNLSIDPTLEPPALTIYGHLRIPFTLAEKCLQSPHAIEQHYHSLVSRKTYTNPSYQYNHRAPYLSDYVCVTKGYLHAIRRCTKVLLAALGSIDKPHRHSALLTAGRYVLYQESKLIRTLRAIHTLMTDKVSCHVLY